MIYFVEHKLSFFKFEIIWLQIEIVSNFWTH